QRTDTLLTHQELQAWLREVGGAPDRAIRAWLREVGGARIALTERIYYPCNHAQAAARAQHARPAPWIVEVPVGPKLEANGPLLCGATGRSCRHRHPRRLASSA